LILPTKRIGYQDSLIYVGAVILSSLKEPSTVSHLWNDIRDYYEDKQSGFSLPFEWFILALDLVNILGIIDYRDGLLEVKA
jgi:hypothetical protein